MPTKNIFDYIVIGAGTAGGVIAKELSDDKTTTVLVLEAGTNMVKELSSPSGAVSGILASDNSHSFNMLTNAEPSIGNQQLRISSGRTIGGSSEHNAMYAVRGSSELYDEWAHTVGSQWSYNNVCSLFIKLIREIRKNPKNAEERAPFLSSSKPFPRMGLPLR